MKNPDDHESRRVAAILRSVLVAAGDALPELDRQSIVALVDAGEWTLALETLCTQVYEYDVDLAATRRDELVSLGAELSVPVGYLLGDPWASRDEPPEEAWPGSVDR